LQDLQGLVNGGQAARGIPEKKMVNGGQAGLVPERTCLTLIIKRTVRISPETEQVTKQFHVNFKQ
jgi:hypothetical protein